VPERTAVYVYGVTWAEAVDALPAAGVAGAGVGAVEHGEIAALVSAVPDEPIRARRRDLTRHMDVLQHVHATAAVLPLQFGSVFADEDAVEEGLLSGRYEELVCLLRRFDGLAELRLRAVYREEAILAEIVQEDRDVARLRRLTQQGGAPSLQLGEAVVRALGERRRRDARALDRELRSLAIEAAVEEPVTELELLRASYLVEQRAIPRFDARMDQIAGRARDRMTFTYTGPLPPHSFVALARAGA
jgi:hypothetical protein